MIKNKTNLLLPEITKYMQYLDDISDDEINLAINMLDRFEKMRVIEYENAIKNNFTRKRLYIFICSLIDLKEIKNNSLNK